MFVPPDKNPEPLKHYIRKLNTELCLLVNSILPEEEIKNDKAND